MKLRQIAFLPLLVLTLPLLGQKLNATHTPIGSNTVMFTVDSAPTIIQDSDNLWNPLYWSFWIYGDGEYEPAHLRPYWNPKQYPPPTKKTSGPPSANPTAKYTYTSTPSTTTYTATSFFIPRKGDDPIPGFVTNNTVTVTGGSSTPDVRKKLLDDGRKIYIEHSQGYYKYKNEKSAFAISYSPSDPCIGSGQVLLFYNSELDLNTGLFTLKNIFNNPNALIPNYGVSSPTPFWSSAKTIENFGAEFQNVFVWSFSPSYISNARSNLNPLGVGNGGELRIFPTFETAAAPTNANPAYALAILTSQCPPPSPPPSPYYSPEAWDRLKKILGGLVSIPTSNSPIKIRENSWVVDVDTIYLKSGEPTDPNTLVIKKVCSCPEKNRFKVTFLLTYTNVGTAPAKKALVRLNSMHPYFSLCEVLDVKYKQGGEAISSYSWESPRLTVNMTDNNHKDGLALRDSVEVTFTMVASIPKFSTFTLRDILEKEFVADGDVDFDSQNNPEPFRNDKLYPNDFIPSGEKCDNCCGGSIWLCWQILLASVLVLSLGWAAWKFLLKK